MDPVRIRIQKNEIRTPLVHLYKYLEKVLFRFAIIYSDFFTCCRATKKRFKFGLRLEYLQE